MDSLTLQMNTLDSYVDKRGGVNRVQTGTSPNNTGVSLSTGTTVPVSSIQWRLTNLFRQHTSSPFSKSDQVCTRPLPAHFRGSVEAARATMLRSFTRSFHYMPTTIALPRLDTILKKIVGPVINSQDVTPAVRLALIELIGQLGRVIQSLDTVTFADGAADTPDSPIPALLALIYCLLEVLNQDFAVHSIQIPTVSSSATPGLLAFPDPTAPSASHPVPCVVSRTIRLKSVEAITGLLYPFPHPYECTDVSLYTPVVSFVRVILSALHQVP
ncbi:hypothetical protein FGIG_04860 [Fasciola gigantica]|uniref:Uncharacterized protein n=1 Tax=Fasciola gigantica TaxID=46835 RepID=A0A504YF16_FASGI|nr:hypothetical protein FGIG_04860 [Fasciola gigantica]